METGRPGQEELRKGARGGREGAKVDSSSSSRTKGNLGVGSALPRPSAVCPTAVWFISPRLGSGWNCRGKGNVLKLAHETSFLEDMVNSLLGFKVGI